ncbi:MAG: twin-arginine translocase subunit TatC [Candidatus Thermoplasmatota archaeon]|nr:twin-arginine translocase subunit TatC [Candidatus Thermoplasmatota archaeon]
MMLQSKNRKNDLAINDSKDAPPVEMSFLDHLEELRWRIIKAASAIIICAIPCGIYWKKLFDWIMIYPLRLSKDGPRLIYTNPTEAFVLSIKIAIYGGIIFSVPVVFYQIWRFVSPGLYKKEKVVILPVVFVSSGCFLAGVGFTYLVVPYLLSFLSAYPGGRLDAMFKASEYLGFLLKLALAFGIVFEMPVVSFILTKLDIITYKVLLKYIRYAIVVIFIIAAILTPPDVLSQTLMAVPLLILYGVSILVSYFAGKKKRD